MNTCVDALSIVLEAGDHVRSLVQQASFLVPVPRYHWRRLSVLVQVIYFYIAIMAHFRARGRLLSVYRV